MLCSREAITRLLKTTVSTCSVFEVSAAKPQRRQVNQHVETKIGFVQPLPTKSNGGAQEFDADERYLRASADEVAWEGIYDKDTSWRERNGQKILSSALGKMLRFARSNTERYRGHPLAMIIYTHGEAGRDLLKVKDKDCFGNGGIGVAAYDVSLLRTGSSGKYAAIPVNSVRPGFLASKGESKLRPKAGLPSWFLDNNYLRMQDFDTCMEGSRAAWLDGLPEKNKKTMARKANEMMVKGKTSTKPAVYSPDLNCRDRKSVV